MNYDELNKLNELKEKGIITEEEFQREKEKLLNAENQQTGTTQGDPFQTTGSAVEYTQYTTNNDTSALKSKMAAGLLGIFLGALGVHNFYLGYTNKAIAQLLITILSCGVLSWASAIWGLVEGIMLLTGEIKTDGKGNPLKD